MNEDKEQVSLDKVFHFALSMYVNEPCRICRRLITWEDISDAVFAGYSADNTARSAHKMCWDNALDTMRDFANQHGFDFPSPEENQQ